MISKYKEILAAKEKFKRKKGAYSYLVKRLKGCWNVWGERAVSCRDGEKDGGEWGYVNQSSENLSEKKKIIQEQGNLIKEKEKVSSTDGPSCKDKEILEAQEKLKKKERAHDGMAKRLEIAETLSTRTVNELSEKEKMIQEQAKLIEEK